MYQNEKQKQTIISQTRKKILDIENQIKSQELKIQMCKNNPIITSSDYVVGDTVKYKLFNIEEGIIRKIYKNGKILIFNNKNQNVPIIKSLIISLIKKNNTLINEIDIYNNTINLLQIQLEFLKKEIIKFEEDTNYYLYNILTDELLQITCPLNTLIKIVEILIFNKYINSKNINNETFLKDNLIIKNRYNL